MIGLKKIYLKILFNTRRHAVLNLKNKKLNFVRITDSWFINQKFKNYKIKKILDFLGLPGILIN